MTGQPFDVEKAMGPIMRRLDKLPALERAKAADELWQQLVEVQAHVATSRRTAVRELRFDHTLAEVAAMLGKSLSRIKQIADGVDRKRE